MLGARLPRDITAASGRASTKGTRANANGGGRVISLDGRRQYAVRADGTTIASADSYDEARAVLLLGTPHTSDGWVIVARRIVWSIVDRHAEMAAEDAARRPAA